MRLCSESSRATSFLQMAEHTLGAGSLEYFRMQPRGAKERCLFDAVQRIRVLLAAAPPPRASSPVVEAGLLAVELVLDPLASEEARIGLHVWPGSSPAQAYRKMMKLCHPDKLPGCAKAASAAIELSRLLEAVQAERDDFRGAALNLAETRLIEAVRRAERPAPVAQARWKVKKKGAPQHVQPRTGQFSSRPSWCWSCGRGLPVLVDSVRMPFSRTGCCFAPRARELRGRVSFGTLSCRMYDFLSGPWCSDFGTTGPAGAP